MKVGIYKIENNINGKCYVGLSIDIKRRWSEHKTNLRLGKHQNKHLQYSYNKYGSDVFTYSILQYCDSENLSEREIYWVNFLDSYNQGYNQTVGGYGLGIGKDHIKYDHTTYTFYCEDGRVEENITKGDMILKYPEEIGKQVYYLAEGTIMKSNGWAMNKENLTNLNNRDTKKYTFYNIDGRVEKNITINDMDKKHFSKINSPIYSLIYGYAKMSNGWVIDEDNFPTEGIGSVHRFQHKDGRKTQLITQAEFGKENNISKHCVNKVVKGTRKTCKGWSLIN